MAFAPIAVDPSNPALLLLPNALAFSPDNRTLAVAVSDREIWLIDVNTATTLAALPVDRMVVSLSFNAAGNTLAVAGEGSWFELWDLHLLRTKLTALNLDWPDQAVK